MLHGTCLQYLAVVKLWSCCIDFRVGWSLPNSATKMLPKSFLLLALLLGVTLLHTNRVVAENDDEVAEEDEEIEGNRRPRAPKTCVHEWEAWMCPKGIIGVCVCIALQTALSWAPSLTAYTSDTITPALWIGHRIEWVWLRVRTVWHFVSFTQILPRIDIKDCLHFESYLFDFVLTVLYFVC